MVVIEAKLNIENSGDISFEANVLGITKDIAGAEDKGIFEQEILPESLNIIENILKNTKVFKPEHYNDFIAKLLNIIVAKAKEKNYRLKRIGQNEKYMTVTQLEFYKE